MLSFWWCWGFLCVFIFSGSISIIIFNTLGFVSFLG